MGIFNNNRDLIGEQRDGFFKRFVDGVRSWIVKSQVSKYITVNEFKSYYDECKEARVWYRGDALELASFYSNYPVDNQSFWKATMTKGLEIRKIHTNAAEVIVDTGTALVYNGYNNMVFEDDKDQEIWDEMSKCNLFRKQLEKAVQDVFVVGDGVFRVAYDKNICNHPMLEFVPGDRCHYIEVMGHTIEIDIITPFLDDNGKSELRLIEKYTPGLIRREVLDSKCKEKDFEKYFPELERETKVPNNLMLAIKMLFYDNPKFEGRGKSILYGKYGDLDALDEIVSQWMDAIRDGRTKTFIPDIYIPADADGNLVEPNPFDNRFIQYSQDMSENVNNKIQTEQATIQHTAYQASYYATFERIISGVWSPATFGSDMKKTDNADAQKEKEKVTLQTRAKIISTLEDILPRLALLLMECEREFNHTQLSKEMKCHADFMEYINPSFEALIESCGKAVTYSIMSTDRAVSKLFPYGATKKEIEEEIEKIRKENENVTRIKKANINTSADAQQHSNVHD